MSQINHQQQEELASLARHAQLAREQSDWARACVLYQQALHIDDKRADLWHHLGLCLVGLGQNAKAILACQRALSLQPALWQSHILIAQSQAAQEYISLQINNFQNPAHRFPLPAR